MSQLFAIQSFDYSNINLNRLISKQTGFDYANDIYYSFNDVTYEDVASFEYLEGASYWLVSFGGTGLTFSQDYQSVTGGTVTGILEDFWTGSEWSPAWSIEGISHSATSLANAAITPSTADDLAIIQAILSGDDDLFMSNYDDVIRGFDGNDLIVGNAGNDRLYGDAGDDDIFGGAGNDYIDGGAGVDYAYYDSQASSYRITKTSGSLTVQDISGGAEGTDTLVSIEKLVFSDLSLNAQTKQAAATVDKAIVDRIAELYVAFFNRVPDGDGMEYWITQYKSGKTIEQIADSFYSAGVQFSELTGFSATMSNADFVNTVYKNVLGRSDGADADGLAYWTNSLATGSETRGSLVSTILDSAHTFKGNATWGWVADLLDNKISAANRIAVDWG